MQLTSTTFVRKVEQLLKYINDKDIYLVYGYIRKHSTNFKINTPSDITKYCILYGFMWLEYFIKHDERRIILTNNYQQITRIGDNYGTTHSSTYGNWNIPSKSKYIYHFSFLIINKIGNELTNTISIGIDESTRSWSNSCFAMENEKINYSYSSAGAKFSNGSGREYGESFATNDIIEMELNLESKKKTLTFYKNGKNLGYAFKNVKSKNVLQYSLVVYLKWFGESVELLSATRRTSNDNEI